MAKTILENPVGNIVALIHSQMLRPKIQKLINNFNMKIIYIIIIGLFKNINLTLYTSNVGTLYLYMFSQCKSSTATYLYLKLFNEMLYF